MDKFPLDESDLESRLMWAVVGYYDKKLHSGMTMQEIWEVAHEEGVMMGRILAVYNEGYVTPERLKQYEEEVAAQCIDRITRNYGMQEDSSH